VELLDKSPTENHGSADGAKSRSSAHYSFDDLLDCRADQSIGPSSRNCECPRLGSVVSERTRHRVSHDASGWKVGNRVKNV